MKKRGSAVHGLIYSAVIGALVLVFFFASVTEIWNDDEIDWEVCRNSIIIRSSLPDVVVSKLEITSFKDSYPLKCETQVVEVDSGELDDMTELNKKVAAIMAECWGLYDSGDSNAFPSSLFNSKTFCVPCARIHFTEKAIERMKSNPEKYTFNIRKAMDEYVDGQSFRYYNWLVSSGELFSPFDLAGSNEFDLEGSSVFRVGGDKSIFNSAEFYLDDGVLMIDAPASYIDLEASEFDVYGLGSLIISEELVRVSHNMAAYLEEHAGEVSDVVDFCDGAEYEDYCTVLYEYVQKYDELSFKNSERWRVVVDYGDESLLVDELEFYMDDDVLWADTFGIDGKAEDLGKGTGINEKLVVVAEEMVSLLSEGEGKVVSDFCKGKEHEAECVILEDYAGEHEEVSIKNVAEQRVVADYSESGTEDDVVFKTKTGLTSEFESWSESVADVSLPEVYDPELGDLLIGYGVATFNVDFVIGSYIPYLFYFQVGQDGVFDEVQKGLFSKTYKMSFCDEWEGVPV